MKIVVVGAGGAAGTVGADIAPIARDFGRVLQGQLPGWRHRFQHLARAVDDWVALSGANLADGWPLHAVWTLVDNYSKLFGVLQAGLGDQRYNDYEASLDLRQAVLQVYGRALLDRVGQNPNGTLAQVVGGLQPGDVIVSMNYDTVVEEVARRLGWPLTLADPHQCRVEEGVTLAKPHGSLAWRQWVPEWGRLVQLGEQPMCLADVGQDQQGSTRQPLIVGPVPFKSEIIRELMCGGQTPDAFQVLMHQWAVVCKAVNQADEIVVLGYSFPPEDLYARFLYREARRAPRGNACRITLYELPGRRVNVEKSILEIFGGPGTIVTIEYRGPVV